MEAPGTTGKPKGVDVIHRNVTNRKRSYFGRLTRLM